MPAKSTPKNIATLTYALIDALGPKGYAVEYMPGDRSTLIMQSPNGARFTVSVGPLNTQAMS